MSDSRYNIDFRDISFVLFEHLPFDDLRRLKAYDGFDRDSARMVLNEFLRLQREVIAPINQAGDRAGCRFEDGEVLTPEGFKEAYRAYCAGGWLGLSTPEEDGGMGLPTVLGAALSEMNIGANCALAICTGLTHSAASLLRTHGSDELKERYLAKMLSGEWQGTMCLTEPQAGTAVGDIRTAARPDGDTWLVEGKKIFISAGEHDMCENHVHFVLARTPDAPAGMRGISLFLVPKRIPDAGGRPGAFNNVVCAGIEHKMGIRASPTCTMLFGEDGPCRGWLIGEVGDGLAQMFHMMNEARIGVGLQGVGLAAQAYLFSRDYARERVQGVDIDEMRNPDAPRVTITHHPNVRRMLLWSKSMVEGMRALLYYAAYNADLARRGDTEEQRERGRAMLELLTPVCKAYCSDKGFEVTRLAIQVMGGYGYLGEYPVEQHMRDIKIASLYEGTNGIQALDLIGRKMPAKGGLYFRTLLQEMEGLVEAQQGNGALGQEMVAFGEQVGRWRDTAMGLAAKGMGGDRRYPALHAYPFLVMTGNVATAWLLLQQGVIAAARREALWQQKGLEEAAERAQAREGDPELAFYDNKVATARFFVNQILPENLTIAAAIASDDRSALDYLA